MSLATSSSAGGFIESGQSVQHAIELLEKGSERAFIRFVDLLDTYRIVDAAHNTLLHWAAAYGCCQLIDHLLSLGLPIDARNASQATPLLCAAASCANPGAAILALALRGADMRATNETGDTVVSLLTGRHLPDVAHMCEALLRSMTEHSACYATSAVVPQPLHASSAPAHVMAHLGTARLLPPGSPLQSVLVVGGRQPPSLPVHKRNAGAGRPPSGLSSGRLRSSEYPLAASSARRLRTGEQQPLGSLNSTGTTALYDSGDNTILRTDCCCDAAWWLADTERALLFAEEGKHRERIRANYFEEHDAILYRFFGIDSVPEDVVDNIVAVLGEKFGPDAQRMLLVRWWVEEPEAVEEGAEPRGAEQNTDYGENPDDAAPEDATAGSVRRVFIEDWVPIDEIATAQKVREYISRFDRTYSTIFSGTSDRFAGFHGNDDSADGEFVLNESEREEMERELGLLPSRRLSSGASSPSRTSLLTSQDAVLNGAVLPARPSRAGSSVGRDRESVSDPEFNRLVMSAGERAARLYQSEKSRRAREDLAEAELWKVESSSPGVAPRLGAQGEAAVTRPVTYTPVMSSVSEQPPSVYFTRARDPATAIHPLGREGSPAASPHSNGDDCGTRDTTDTTQYSFPSGTTLPPSVQGSTGTSAMSTSSETAIPQSASPLSAERHNTAQSSISDGSETVVDETGGGGATTLPSPVVSARRSPAVRSSLSGSPSNPPQKRPSNVTPTQYRLTDSQKSAYEKFLFTSALRMLKK